MADHRLISLDDWEWRYLCDLVVNEKQKLSVTEEARRRGLVRKIYDAPLTAEIHSAGRPKRTQELALGEDVTKRLRAARGECQRHGLKLVDGECPDKFCRSAAWAGY